MTVRLSSRRRLFALLAVGLLLLSAIPVTAHVASAPDDARVFFADDTDPKEKDYPDFGHADLGWVTETDEKMNTLAKAYDFYYYSSRPQTEVGSENVTLSEFRENQLERVSRNSSSSKWPNTAPTPKDGEWVKDAYISFLGVDGGAEYNGPTAADGAYFIASDGAVLNMLDYRVEMPTGDCDVNYDRQLINGTQQIVGGTKTCVAYNLADKTVTRRLSIGPQTWVAVGDERRIEYQGAAATGEATIRLEATIGVEVERITRSFDYDANNSTWLLQSRDVNRIPKSLTVSDSARAYITSNQELQVHQRVIDISEDKKAIVLTFNGPDSLTNRRIWSRAMFNKKQSLRNVWGIYSVQRYQGGKVATTDHPSPREYHFPHALRMQFTARTDKPAAQYNSNGEVGYARIPEVVDYQRHQVGTGNASLPGDVNLPTSKVYLYDQIVLENAPDRVQTVYDIHGEPIPVTTEVDPYHQTHFEFTRLEDDKLRIRLVTSSGEGVPNREVLLSGVSVEATTTNENGAVVVEKERNVVSAEFAGDNWRIDRNQYYGAAQATRVIQSPGQISQAINDLIVSAGYALPWILLGVLAYAMRRRD